MKKLSVLLSSLAILYGCTSGSLLSVEDGVVSYDGTPAGVLLAVLDDTFSYSDDIEYIDDNTFGATSVSTRHHHLDVYAVMWGARTKPSSSVIGVAILTTGV